MIRLVSWLLCETLADLEADMLTSWQLYLIIQSFYLISLKVSSSCQIHCQLPWTRYFARLA